MHESVLKFVQEQVTAYKLREAETLEVGARNVNGSARPYFDGSYVGIDMEPGPGVDVVARADAIPFGDESFDCVLCTEMLEHDPYPWRSMEEMARVLRPEGVLVLTTRGIGFPLHAYPDDYWRYTPSAIRHLSEMVGLTPLVLRDDPQPGHPGVFVVARKDDSGGRRRVHPFWKGMEVAE